MKVRWVVLALVVAVLGSSRAEAGRRHRGSSGSSGSYGSSGSSGSSGSYGSYGSSGSSGSYGSSGSSGSYGSSGSSGSYGSSGSSGSYGSYGSYGSAGASYYGSYSYPAAPATPATPVPAAAAAPESARLILNVPEDAVVYLVDQRMTTSGPVRQFSVPKVAAGKTYGYPIRIEVIRNGEKHEISASQKLRARDRVELVCRVEAGALKLSQKSGQKGLLELTIVSPTQELASK